MPDTFAHLFASEELGEPFGAEARRWDNPDGSPGGIVAASARIDPGVRIEEGAEIWPFATIAAGAVVESGAQVGLYAVVAHHARIGAHASVGHFALLDVHVAVEGWAVIRRGARIGAGAVIGFSADVGGRAVVGHGAGIGVRAAIGVDVRIGARATIGPDAVVPDQAYLVDHVRLEPGEPFLTVGPVGPRATAITVVRSQAAGLQWWTGGESPLSTEEVRRHLAEYARQDSDLLVAFVERHFAGRPEQRSG